MHIFGYPIEIWFAAFVAMLIRLQTSNTLTALGAIVTVCVALFAGVILYQPVMLVFGLGEAWAIPIAIIVALSAENLMKAIVELSADKEWLTDWIRFFVDRGDSKSRRSTHETNEDHYNDK